LDPITDLFHTMHVASVVHRPCWRSLHPWGLMRGAEDANEAAAHSSAAQEFAVPVRALRHGFAWQLLAERKRDSGSDSAHRRRLLPVSSGEHVRLAGQPTYTCAQFVCEAAPKNRSNVIHYWRRRGPDHGNLGMVQLWPDERQAPKTSASRVDSGQGRSSPNLALHATLQLLASEMAEPCDLARK